MTDEVTAFDPYALPPEDILDPPATTWEALRKIGPGIILAGTIVGSGELILTTSLGAKHGFAFLWLILFSCVIKVFVQIELGRYAISSGRPTLGVLNELPGPRFGAHLLVWWWFIMMICTVVQLGGIAGSVGQSLDLAFPSLTRHTIDISSSLNSAFGEMVRHRPATPWAIATCLVTMALIYGGGYRRIEWITTLIVVSVTLITVTAALALGWTGFPVRGADVLSGLEFQIPKDGLPVAFAVFGVTGVGATELFYYPYWCLEKGYARYVGRADGTEAWERRAKGWVRVMHLDAWVSMCVFTVSTVAFYLMGAAVLHPQHLVPQGAALIKTLSEMYVGPFGAWTRILFLIGAAAVLFKTLYLACAANSRLTADFLVLAGMSPNKSAEHRAQWIKRFCLVFPVLALTFFVIFSDPKLMVTIGGIAQAATLPMIALATLFFRYFKVNRALRPWPITDLLLWVAVVSIVVFAGYAVPTQVRDVIKQATQTTVQPSVTPVSSETPQIRPTDPK